MSQSTMNIINSSAILTRIIRDTSNSLTTAIRLIAERNSTTINFDVHQSIVRIMWYRFLLIIIILVTAAGNILVCLAIARERKLQNTTNYFLMSLAVADCLVAILVMPMAMITEVIGHFPLPHYACIIFATLDVLCCTSSIWHMSTMSMDRYFTIRFPFRYGRNKTRRIMLLKIIAVWAISTAICSPIFVLGIVDKENVLVDGTCAPDNAKFKIYGSVFAFYIPFIIMITTYALTMRSLRNVLVHKKKYNRERRRKQTFRPLAQIINQYAEIAQSIRRASATTTNQTRSSNLNSNLNLSGNKTPFTIVTTSVASPTDIRTSIYSNPTSEAHRLDELNNPQYGSMTMNNDSNLHQHHSNQHLTISYVKSSGSKKKRHHQQQQQQALGINITGNRLKNDCDMSTVYEITEYSKSTSSSHDVTFITNNNSLTRRSILPDEGEDEQVTSKIVDSTTEQQEESTLITTTTTTTTTTNVNREQSLTGKQTNSMKDINGTTEDMDRKIKTDIQSINSDQNETIPWKSYSALVECIVRYYLFIFPYRSHPLALISSSSSNSDEMKFKSLVLHQATSTSSLIPITNNNSRSISTQTNLFPSKDYSNLPRTPNIHPTELNLYNPPKRRKFPSSSVFTNFFRSSPMTLLRSQQSSIKSSMSLGPCSSGVSSTCPIRRHNSSHKYSSNTFYQIESDIDHVLTDDQQRHLRTSSSSSTFLRSTHRQRPFKRRQQYQSRSAYYLTNPYSSHTRRQQQQQQQQPLTSTTNTTSSDSSSVFHRFNPRFFSTISQQQSHAQRLRDEHIVAANERKALKVLMIIFCVFVALWTPFFICTFISALSQKCRERITPTIWFSITWLGYSSSMANPFIYTIFSDVFRRAFINILFCRSSDTSFSAQLSTKFSQPKGAILTQHYIHPRHLQRRSPNHEQSGTSSPIHLHQPVATMPEGDATIYINRCASDSFR